MREISPDVAAAKRALRTRLRDVDLQLTGADRIAAAAALADRLLALERVQRARIVAAYASLPSEPPTSQLIDALRSAGVIVLLPVLQADDSLAWREHVAGTALVAGRRGLLEPGPACRARLLSDADVVLVPGVAYDPAGNRLGRGGGSYDRALRDIPRDVLTVGLALDSGVVDSVPVEAHDQPVQMIVTPTRVIPDDDGGS